MAKTYTLKDNFTETEITVANIDFITQLKTEGNMAIFTVNMNGVVIQARYATTDACLNARKSLIQACNESENVLLTEDGKNPHLKPWPSKKKLEDKPSDTED